MPSKSDRKFSMYTRSCKYCKGLFKTPGKTRRVVCPDCQKKNRIQMLVKKRSTKYPPSLVQRYNSAIGGNGRRTKK